MTVLREIAPHGLAGSRHEATIPAGTMAEAMDRVRNTHTTYVTPDKEGAFKWDARKKITLSKRRLAPCPKTECLKT